MELKVFESPGKEWDDFASRYTDLIFYQSIWSEVLRKGLAGQPLYFYLKEGEEIVAGLPGVLLNFRVIKILYASIPYGNFIGQKSRFPVFTELLENEFRRRRIDQVRVSESPFSESYQPNRFRSIAAKCTLLDLSGFDQESLWEGYKKYIRRDIRKAQRNGVTIRTGASQEDVGTFYRLYLASMERNRAAAKYPLPWFQALYEGMVGRGLGVFLLAELNQVAIAGAVLVYSPYSIHYLHNGSRYEFLKFCPNELLIHCGLDEAMKRRASYFDFMGSDASDLFLLQFKEKWGGRSRPIMTYVKDYRPLRCRMWELGKRLGNSRIGRGLLRVLWH